ncbi:hypothetical protein ACIQ9R_31040 [Streptomyces sp. NPDC094447]|uniref:hypothetical protein n=1 Tax=Streptomyces sp. NPDC094447 TaxID=3366062 RepID=UPI00382863B6
MKTGQIILLSRLGQLQDLDMKRSLKSNVTRLGVTAAVLAAAGLLSTAPASANSPQPTPAAVLSDRQIVHSLGSMRFIDDGDVFEICDWKKDSLGVVGKLWYKPAGGDWYVTEAKQAPDNGCTKMPHDVHWFGDWQMRLYWNGKELVRSESFAE